MDTLLRVVGGLNLVGPGMRKRPSWCGKQPEAPRRRHGVGGRCTGSKACPEERLLQDRFRVVATTAIDRMPSYLSGQPALILPRPRP